MYFSVFLLYLLECGLGAIDESATYQPKSKIYFEDMWRKNGRGSEETAERPHQSPRRAREADKVAPAQPKFKPQDYYGFRAAAIVTILNSGTYGTNNLRQAYGVQLLPQMVLTLCSAVTYVDRTDQKLTLWDHPAQRYPVTKCLPSDMDVHVMTSKDFKASNVLEVLIHPKCDNQYDVDLAVLKTEPILNSKNVWIHTAENLLFRRNLDRVVAAQAVLGKCEVPVFSVELSPEPNKKDLVYEVKYVRINFQHWTGCEQNICPFWSPPSGVSKHYDPDRCKNQRTGTRFCTSWTIAEKGLCDLSAGTPVFCDVGNVHGVMGFLPRIPYTCWPAYNKSAVMQGLNDGIPWIRQTIVMYKEEDYDKSIPGWMKSLEEQFSDEITPRVKPKAITKRPDIDATFANFIGQQYLSIVNVYINTTFACRGVIVHPKIVLLPCSCVTYDTVNDLSKDVNVYNAHALLNYNLDDNRFLVSLMVNGTEPHVQVAAVEINKYCDSHYVHDTAWATLEEPLPLFKLAWLMTHVQQEFARLMWVTMVSDAAMGHNCYYLEGGKTRMGTPIKRRIRFLPWSRCIHNVCPDKRFLERLQGRCFLYNYIPTQVATLCVESQEHDQPACEITHGTPVFCNLEQARGFVGLITVSMDVNTTPCRKRTAENQTAVLHVIYDFLPQLKEYTWIQQLSNAREYAYGFTESVMPWRTSATLLITTFIVKMS